MKLAVGVIGSLVALVAAVAGIGALMDREHHASRAMRLARPPEEVWTVLTDRPGMTAWRGDLKAMERAADIAGHEAWKEIDANGEMIIETVSMDAPRKLVLRIHDPGENFGGTWTFDLTSADGGTRVRITEDGEVYNPIFRFFSRFMDPRETTTAYLTDLARKFGESPRFEE